MSHLGSDIKLHARTLQIQREQINPLISAVLGTAAGSSQRVDRDMVRLLDSCLSALDSAIGDLHAALRLVGVDPGESTNTWGSV